VIKEDYYYYQSVNTKHALLSSFWIPNPSTAQLALTERS